MMFMAQLMVCLSSCQLIEENIPKLFHNVEECKAYAKELAEEVVKEIPIVKIGYRCVPTSQNNV
jgi:hypothetical protein